MTVGSDVRDLRTWQSTGCGMSLVGLQWSRVWSGGDASPQPDYGPPADDPSNGSYASSPRRPPKRGRSLGEHDYTCTINSSLNGIFTWTEDSVSKTGTAESCFGGATYSFGWTSNDDITLLNKLRPLIAGSDFNPGVTTGEGKKALETIAANANALAGAYYHAKRGNWNAASKSLAKFERKHADKGVTVAKGWLEFQYGVKPILNDTYNAAIMLAHLNSVPQRKVYTVTLKVPGVLGSASPSNVKYSGVCYSTGKIKAILSSVDINKLIGLTNPSTVAWELMPYSFVIDWFVPIGAYLSALGVSGGLTGTFVTTRMDKAMAEGPYSVKPTLSIAGGGTGTYFKKYVYVNRDVSDNLSVPMPNIKSPDKWLSWQRAMSALSLLWSQKPSLRGAGSRDYTE